jgi:hypothetical protein
VKFLVSRYYEVNIPGEPGNVSEEDKMVVRGIVQHARRNGVNLEYPQQRTVPESFFKDLCDYLTHTFDAGNLTQYTREVGSHGVLQYHNDHFEVWS